MIGKIIPFPSCSRAHIKFDGNTLLKSNSLNRQFTSSVAKVENSNVDLRTFIKELSLYRAAKYNPHLAKMAKAGIAAPQNQRFSILGVGVSAVSNFMDQGISKQSVDTICKAFPKNPAIDPDSDIVMKQRGQEYIRNFTKDESIMDPTNYAIALDIGDKVKNGLVDHFMFEQFDKTWGIRLKEIN